jgi:hypothetical protein
MTTTDDRSKNHRSAVASHEVDRAGAETSTGSTVDRRPDRTNDPADDPAVDPADGTAVDRLAEIGSRPVGGPVPLPWREGTLTRAKEIESLAYGFTRSNGSRFSTHLLAAIDQHLAAARQAAKRTTHSFGRRRDSALLQRAISNLDAAQADLLQMAPASYVLGQVPSLLNEVQRHLTRSDPRRQEFERIATVLGMHPPDRAPVPGPPPLTAQERTAIVELERNKIVSIARGANSAALREQLRVRSFRAVLMVSAGVMALLAVLLGLLGWVSPSSLALCFQPEQNSQVVVICPTGQSGVAAVDPAGAPVQPQIDALVHRTVRPADIAVVELVGLIAASIASAAALRRIRGSSEPHGLPVALALLKLPTGALTAVLGLLLMRGEFVPGLTALDTSGQIIAWSIVFGYAQQLFTRFVDQQADSVLNEVRGARGTLDPAPSTP